MWDKGCCHQVARPQGANAPEKRRRFATGARPVSVLAVSERLIPYRTVQRQETEVSVQLIVAAVGGVVTLRYFPSFAVFGAIATYLVAALLYVSWTRVARFERVTVEEQLRRHALELAQRPIWVQAVNEGASIGTVVSGSALLCLVPEHYAALPPIVISSFLAGAFLGLYLAIDARRDATKSGISRAPLSFAESIGRHVSGYAMGLAGALAVATAIDDPSFAVVAMLVAFLSAKFATDMLLAGGASPFPDSDERLRWYHFLLALPFGAIWWGLPFGVLGVLVTFTVNPDASSPLLLRVFVGVLVATGVGATISTIMAILMALVRRSDEGVRPVVTHRRSQQ
jgi:hypothetical protein